MDRRYCRPSCRTLAYRIRLRTRQIEHGPTAVPRWAYGRLPELAFALTTLGRVQGDVTVLARQMACEEAAVRSWLLRLRGLGDLPVDVPPPDPEFRLRQEGDQLRTELDDALAKHNEVKEELLEHETSSFVVIARLRKELETVKKKLAETEKLAAASEGTTADDAKARKRIAELESQHTDEQAEIGRLRTELSTTKDDLQEIANKLQTAEKDRSALLDGKAQAEKELAALREAPKQPRARTSRAASGAGTPRPSEKSVEPTTPSTTRVPSAAMNSARIRMDEQILNITRAAGLAFLHKAREQGHGESIETWLSRHVGDIHQAAQLLARTALTSRMGQDAGIPITSAATDSYLQTLDHLQSTGHSASFVVWFKENRDFLLMLSTALIAALDARSSTNETPTGAVIFAPIASPERPKERSNAALREAIPSPMRESYQPTLPVAAGSPMPPRIPRVDSLFHLMKDKVQLLHTLAELQDERLEKVTGQFLEPFNETTIAAAAKHAAREARREYYFRPHGLSVAAAQLHWVIEDELLDPRSEDALFGEVIDQIERLKVAVEKVKPQRKPW